MALQSKIEWTESTWNPVTGCTKISTGCKNCYAERMAKRLKAMGNPSYESGFEVAIHERILDYPLHWKKPQMIFVNSMSDLFHKKVPSHFIERVFGVMGQADWHNFQVLTKRSKRLALMNSGLEWASNIWMGVSVENEDCIPRIFDLVKSNARIKFLSLEPLLAPLPDLPLDGIDWVIVGGESGPGSRKIEEEWVIDIRDQCLNAGVPFFFKQWGGTNKKKNGRLLKNRTWDQMPDVKSLHYAFTGSSD